MNITPTKGDPPAEPTRKGPDDPQSVPPKKPPREPPPGGKPKQAHRRRAE